MRLRLTVNDGIGKKFAAIAELYGLNPNTLAAKLVYTYTASPADFETVTGLIAKRNLNNLDKEKEREGKNYE